MLIINVERFNHITKKLEAALINSDAIVWVREFQIPGVPIHKQPWACDVWLTSGDCLTIHSTIEALEEAIYFASLPDSKPETLARNPWGRVNTPCIRK